MPSKHSTASCPAGPPHSRPRADLLGQQILETTIRRELTARDGVYVGLRYGFGILIGLANMFALTWWIGPHDYGVFVAAIGLSAFLGSLTRAGADTYLVRRETPPDGSLYNVATSLIVCVSLGLVLLGMAAVPALVRWYDSREFALPYLTTLATVPLTGIAGPAIAKLERELNFRSAAGIELAGQFLALVVSAFLAWRRMGVWAPVAGAIASQTWVAIAAWRAAQIAPRFVWNAREVREMLSFGLGYTLSLRVWQLRSLVNPLLVGRLLGADAVAFVALAIRIAESLGFIRSAAGRLAVVGLSRLRTEPERFRAAVQKGLELQVLTLGPLLCAFAMAAPFVVDTFFGARWKPAVQVFPWVALAVLLNSVFNLQASALYVLGKQWSVLWTYCAHILVFGSTAYLFVSRVGIQGYGWADLVACLSYGWLHRKLNQQTRLSYRRTGWWCAAFGLPLFARIVSSNWNWGLWLPLAVLAITQGKYFFRNSSAEESAAESLSKPWLLQPDSSPVPHSLELSQP